jgi:hypothetical protein
MTVAKRFSIAILSVVSAAAASYLYLSLPQWQLPALLFALVFSALLLVLAKRPAGYSLGQLGLLLIFLVALLITIGDYETSDPRPATFYRYLALGTICVAFVFAVMILRKARAEITQANGTGA